MAKIKPEMHLVRFRCYGPHQGSVQIPAEIRTALGMNHGMYLGAVRMGDCVLLTRVQSVDPEGFEQELSNAITQAVRDWAERQKVSPASAA